MKYYIGIITVLVLMNIYLFSKVNTQSLTKSTEDITEEVNFETNVRRDISLREAVSSNEELVLLKVFPRNACNLCFNKDVKILNRLYQKYPDHVMVYHTKGRNENSDNILRFGPEYKFETVDTLAQGILFDQEISISNPTSFIVYKNNVIDYFETKITNFEQSEIFHERIDSIFSRLAY